jgi:type VI secretion system (T6SS) baseplate-like injector VgrG
MGRNLHSLLTDDDGDRDSDERWMIAVEAIVAENEDPEHQHRIKVVIPTLEENEVRDEWVRQMGCYVGGPGYGSFFVPAIGSEVVLFGRLGQKYNLFYMSVYNEDYVVPADFDSSAVCGVRAPADMKFMSEGDMQLRAGEFFLESDGKMHVIAPGGFFVNGKPV